MALISCLVGQLVPEQPHPHLPIDPLKEIWVLVELMALHVLTPPGLKERPALHAIGEAPNSCMCKSVGGVRVGWVVDKPNDRLVVAYRHRGQPLGQRRASQK